MRRIKKEFHSHTRILRALRALRGEPLLYYPLRWSSRRTRRLQHHPLYPVFQLNDIEIDEQAHATVGQLHIGEQLGFMDGC